MIFLHCFRSTNGSSQTNFGGDGDRVFFTIFIVNSANFSLSGFQVNGAVTPHPILAEISNSNVHLTDVLVKNSVGSLVSLNSSSLVVSNSEINLCASIVFFEASESSSISVSIGNAITKLKLQTFLQIFLVFEYYD